MASEISLLTWRFQHFPGRKSCQRRCLRKRRNHRTHNQLLTKPPIAASLLFKGRLCPSSARGGPSSFPWHGHTCTRWAPQPAVKQNQNTLNRTKNLHPAPHLPLTHCTQVSQDHSRKIYRLGPRSAICNLFSTRFWATYLVDLLLFITLENTISNKSGFKRPLPSTQIRITWLYFSWQLFPSCKSEGISCTSIFPTLHHNRGHRFYCLRHNEKIKHQVIKKKPFNEAHCKRNENNNQKPLKGKRRILVGKI